MPYVESTMISWVDYDPDTKRLSVRMRAAPVLYTYVDVPEQVYRTFLAADSMNSFYQLQIVPAFRLETQPLNRAGDGSPPPSEETSPPDT